MLTNLLAIAFITLLGLSGLYVSIFKFNKEVFYQREDYGILRNFLMLPPLINYWLFKIFLLAGGLITTIVGVMLFFRDFF